MEKIVFIGCGAIGKTLIEIWNIEKLHMKNKITIIEPEPLPEWLIKSRKIHHIQIGITPDNANMLLKNIDNTTLVIDVSVGVDSLLITEICVKKGSMYINTSLENWEETTTLKKDYKDFKKNTLYFREQLMKMQAKTKSTIVIDHGFNPGIIQAFALTAIDKLSPEPPKDYAERAKELEIVSIQVVEFDSQLTDFELYPDIFVNTWSSLGFQAEGTDHCMIGYGTLDNSFEKYKLITPTDGEKNVRFINNHSMDLEKESITLDPKGKPFKYTGMLITHGESNTLSRFLTTKDKSYRPSVYYVYSPSKIAWECLKQTRKNNYEPLPYWHVLEQDEITNDGFDSIGALLTFKDGKQYWSGSVLSISDVKKLGFKYATATTLQVGAALNSAIEYILTHKKEGYQTPEQLDHKYILDHAKKYLGNLYFTYL
jgi:homospermidine synthase